MPGHPGEDDIPGLVLLARAAQELGGVYKTIKTDPVCKEADFATRYTVHCFRGDCEWAAVSSNACARCPGGELRDQIRVYRGM